MKRKKPIWPVKQRARIVHFNSWGKSLPNVSIPRILQKIVETINIEMFLQRKKSKRAAPLAMARLKKIEAAAVPRA